MFDKYDPREEESHVQDHRCYSVDLNVVIHNVQHSKLMLGMRKQAQRRLAGGMQCNDKKQT